MNLSANGYALRMALAEVGVEVTPKELSESIIEASNRIIMKSTGCVQCGQKEDRDFRYGLCDKCAFPDET